MKRRGNAERIEGVLHGFKLTLTLFAAVAVVLVLATVALTNLYLTRHLYRHIARPLDLLTEGVARIRDGDLDTPIAYGGTDEFKPACDAVDEVAARLKASLEQQAAQQQKQELIAGMSHDLKSPLTAIRAYTEGLLEGVAQDEETRQRYLQTIAAIERDYLEFSGYEVTVCGDGVTGLAAALYGCWQQVGCAVRRSTAVRA